MILSLKKLRDVRSPTLNRWMYMKLPIHSLKSYFGDRGKLYRHLVKGFFPSWTHSMCLVKLFFCENLALQMLYLKGFFHSWTDSMCPSIQASISCKANSITDVAFKRLLSLMNCVCLSQGQKSGQGRVGLVGLIWQH